MPDSMLVMPVDTAQSPQPSSLLPDVSEDPAVVEVPRTARHVALTILAVVAVVFVLEWARTFFITMLLGILFAYTLNPLVVWLDRLHIPRLLGTGAVMLGVVAALAFGGYSLRGQTQIVLDQLPAAVSRLSASLERSSAGEASTMQKVQTAASTIEQATSEVTGTPSTSRLPATRVVIDEPGFKVGDFLLEGSTGAAGAIAQALMVLFLTFFLLLSGDSYKRKLVRLTGPSLSNKKITVQILDDINQSIQRYMFMMLATNVLVALCTWTALRLVGLETAGAWAVAAGLLHLIPYLGPGVTAAGIGMTAFVQFDAFAPAVLAASVSLLIATLVGTFVTTWMTGRIARMNTAAVFVSLMFWSWMWGVWGMLLSIPITVIVKVVAQHVKPLRPVAELLGD